MGWFDDAVDSVSNTVSQVTNTVTTHPGVILDPGGIAGGQNIVGDRGVGDTFIQAVDDTGDRLGTSGVGGVVRSVTVDPFNMVRGIPDAVRTGDYNDVGKSAGRFYATGAVVVGAAYAAGAWGGGAAAGGEGASDAAASDSAQVYFEGDTVAAGSDTVPEGVGYDEVAQGSDLAPNTGDEVYLDNGIGETTTSPANVADAGAKSSPGFWQTVGTNAATGLVSSLLGGRKDASPAPVSSGSHPLTGGSYSGGGQPYQTSGGSKGPGILSQLAQNGSVPIALAAAAIAFMVFHKKSRAA